MTQFLTVSLLAAPTNSENSRKVEEVANNFEALLLNQLYSQMENAGRWVDVGDDNPFAPTQAQKIFEGFRNQEVLKNLAARRPLGVAVHVERQLTGQNGVDKSRIHNSTLLELNPQRPESQMATVTAEETLEETSTEETIHGRHEAQKR
jgi:Rod binding domain-containing protein